jgi:hypothetical protein
MVLLQLLKDFVACRPNSRLGSIVHTKFVENVNHMTFDGVRTDGKDVGYFSIGGALCDEAKNFYLPSRKVCLNFVLGIFKKPFLFQIP